MKKIKVTVWVITYNHVNYIEQCLESIVSQETNFLFKLIVHDDASTDGTAEVIRKFAAKYPDVIVPILQTVNQYSQKINIYKNFIMPLIEGDYVACCEGDDAWIDKHKLQTQIDWLDSHSECSACGHNVNIIDYERGEDYVAAVLGGNEGYLSLEKIVDWGFILHINSIVYRSKWARFPEFVTSRYDMMDMQMMIYLRLCGEIYRFGKIMSIYRYMIPNSWSARLIQKHEDIQEMTVAAENLAVFFRGANDFSNGKYERLFLEYELLHLEYGTEGKLTLSPEQKAKIRKLSWMAASKIYFKIYIIIPLKRFFRPTFIGYIYRHFKKNKF